MDSQLAKISCLVMVPTSLLLLGVGCASQGQGTALGGAIGAGTGAVLGAIADPGKKGEYRTRNVIVGTAAGGLAGMLAGAVVQNEVERQKKEAFLKGRASNPPQKRGEMPTLKPAEIETRWIEGHAMGPSVWVDGHYEYRIVSPSRWEP